MMAQGPGRLPKHRSHGTVCLLTEGVERGHFFFFLTGPTERLRLCPFLDRREGDGCRRAQNCNPSQRHTHTHTHTQAYRRGEGDRRRHYYTD